MKNLLLSAVLLLTAVAARAQVVAERSWDRLEGQHSGVKESMAVAVQDQQKWEELWRRHDAEAPVPSVDFSKENVVVVFLGQTRTSGVKVEIVVQKDPIDASRLNVFYREVLVKKGFAAQVQCQPYAFVKIPKAATVSIEKDAVAATPGRELPPAAQYDGRKAHALIESLGTPSFDGR